MRVVGGFLVMWSGALSIAAPPLLAVGKKEEIMPNEDGDVPEDRFYTSEHESLLIEGETARIGLTSYAQEELGDIVFVDLPDVGTHVSFMAKLGEVESVKVANEIFSPASGEVTSKNEALGDRPELVNQDPFGEGWLVTMRLTEPTNEELMDAASYRELIRRLRGE
jgi:glycine cleavage system H protein